MLDTLCNVEKVPARGVGGRAPSLPAASGRRHHGTAPATPGCHKLHVLSSQPLDEGACFPDTANLLGLTCAFLPESLGGVGPGAWQSPSTKRPVPRSPTSSRDPPLQCFLQFGYAKTSMDDVAKRANLSRPLIYLKFKSKQDLVRGIYVDFMKSALEQAESILRSKTPTKAKLAEVVGAINVRAWEKVVGQPMTKEFYPLCEQQFPEESKDSRDNASRSISSFLVGTRRWRKHSSWAIDGFCADAPSVKMLRARMVL